MGRVTRTYRGKSAPDTAIAALAAAQHGIVTRSQLRSLALGDDQIDYRLRVGRLHRLHCGVYAAGHRVLTEDGRRLAAVLSCGPGAALSHRSAAALWKLIVADPRCHDVSVPGRAGRTRADVRLHRPRSLTHADLTTHRGVPTTTPERTLADLRQVAGPRAVERATQEALFLRLLADRHERPITRTRLKLEELMLALIRRHDLPTPRCNEPVTGASGRVYRGDFAWPEHDLVVETDGRAAHGTAAAFERDRERDVDLTLAGQRVLRFTYRHVTAQEAYVAATMRALLTP